MWRLVRMIYDERACMCYVIDGSGPLSSTIH